MSKVIVHEVSGIGLWRAICSAYGNQPMQTTSLSALFKQDPELAELCCGVLAHG